MRISPMSKVQSPMANVQSPTSPENREGYGIRGGDEADFGPWTLDFGLTVTDLRKSFSSPSGERIEVLRGASFSAGPGETVAIMGSSGAGKSTLLHLLGGLEAADHGTIVAGQFSIDSARPFRTCPLSKQSSGFRFSVSPSSSRSYRCGEC